MNISGKMTIFVNEKMNEKEAWFEYVTTVGKKDKDGNWNNVYLRCFFSSECELPENRDVIDVIDGWLTVSGSGDWKRAALFINDYQLIEEDKPTQKAPANRSRRR